MSQYHWLGCGLPDAGGDLKCRMLMPEISRQFIKKLQLTRSHCLVICIVVCRFWITWSGDVIRVGEGVIPGYNLLMQWYIKNFIPVTGVSVATSLAAEGQWMFDLSQGKRFFDNVTADC
jgi:hypothetical protein